MHGSNRVHRERLDSGWCVAIMSNRLGRARFWYRLRGEAGVGMLSGGALAVSAAALVGLAISKEGPNPVERISLSAPRVVVLKAQRVLHLFDGDLLVRAYPVDLGTSPAGPKRRKGDGRTPVGSFRVVTAEDSER